MTSSLKTRIVSISLTVMAGMNSRTIPRRLPRRVGVCVKALSGTGEAYPTWVTVIESFGSLAADGLDHPCDVVDGAAEGPVTLAQELRRPSAEAADSPRVEVMPTRFCFALGS